MGSSRNGTKPEQGERGVATSVASAYAGDSLFQYMKYKRPTTIELHNMIEFDPWAESIEGALTWPIRAGKWAIKPAEDDTGEAEFVNEQFKKIASSAIGGSLSAVGRRIACAEEVWGLDGEDVVLEDLAFRPADQCQVIPDANGRPKGFRQRAFAIGRGFVNEEFLFEERKAFIYFHNSDARPGVGKSALESAYQHYLEKEKVNFYGNKNLEKYGGPSTKAKTDAQPGSDERKEFERAAVELRSVGTVVMGTQDDIEYLQPPNAGDAFEQKRRSLNFEMAVASFVQWLALAQEGNSGAYELSRDHSDFLTIVTEGRMAELADALTSGPIHDITFYNFGPGAAFPTFEFEALSEHISKRMTEAAMALFAKTGRPAPKWIAEGVVDGWARNLGIEKPMDADPVGEPVKPEPASLAVRNEDSSSSGNQA